MTIKKTILPKKDEVKPAQKDKTCCCKKHGVCSIISFVFLTLVVVCVLAKTGLVCWKYNNLINRDTYQVVFLNNGESYFGKLENIGFNAYRLSNVYYLKYFPKNQQTETETTETNPQNNPNYELKLIKLGNQEFYKPVNEMIINKENVVYWENLQDNSDIINFIKNDK